MSPIIQKCDTAYFTCMESRAFDDFRFLEDWTRMLGLSDSAISEHDEAMRAGKTRIAVFKIG
jgi:hypothetical protein